MINTIITMNPIKVITPAAAENIAVKNGTGVPMVPGFGSYMVTSKNPPKTTSPMSISATIGMVMSGSKTDAIVGFFFGFDIILPKLLYRFC